MNKRQRRALSIGIVVLGLHAMFWSPYTPWQADRLIS